MARKPRVDVAGGLYHMITRGNNRRAIFESAEDYTKFLSLLEIQKGKLPFFLYAYCLMSNHVHLLMERQADPLSRVMHRVLTGYSQYYNRKYRRSGHLLQGRHKAILCQSDRYLSELVRYIHLNPVRAGMVRKPENYQYSSHRYYLGEKTGGLVDVDPVLRHFGAKKKVARERYCEFVRAGMKLGHRDEFYRAEEGRILGSEEFVDATIHRLGELEPGGKAKRHRIAAHSASFDAEALITAVEQVCGLERQQFCSRGKDARLVRVKEALILVGSRTGASNRVLSDLVGLSSSTVSRRHDSAYGRLRSGDEKKLTDQIEELYWRSRT
jgi:REP element-mobilizing transposase RayT